MGKGELFYEGGGGERNGGYKGQLRQKEVKFQLDMCWDGINFQNKFVVGESEMFREGGGSVGGKSFFI